METNRLSKIAVLAVFILATFGWITANNNMNTNRITGYISAAVNSIVDKLSDYYKHKPEDRVYAHFDKPMYKPGETIWFNVYLRDAADFSKSSKSDIVNVEFINPKGGVEKSYKIVAKNGVAPGTIDLGEEIAGGIYKVKVYSQWQKNENSPPMFEKEIQIQKLVLPRLKMKIDFLRKAYSSGDEVKFKLNLNTNENLPLANYNVKAVASLNGAPFETKKTTTDENGFVVVGFELPKNLKTNDGLVNVMIDYEGQTESISRAIPIVLNNISLDFFPEGGDLVDGLTTNVAFRARNEFGKAADIEGVIVDENEKEIVSFSSYHNGMGAFELKPQSGNTYHAKITKPSNINKKYELPEALPRGYVLNIKKIEKEGITVQIASTEKETLQLVAQIRGNVCYAESINAKRGITEVVIPAADFPVGTAQFTLFDSKQIARCERLAFVNKHKQLNIEIETDKEKYLPREKVKMTIKVTDERGMPMPAQLSLAVADDRLLSFADDKSSNILSHMLLEADIKDKVEEPNFYFDPKEEKADKALDYLLMTSGWRRFTWKEVMDDNLPSLAHRGEKACFGGKIVDENYEGLKNAKLEFVETGKVAYSDENGKFYFDFIDLTNGATLRVREQKNESPVREYNIANYTTDYYIEMYPVLIMEEIGAVDNGDIEMNIAAGNVRRNKVAVKERPRPEFEEKRKEQLKKDDKLKILDNEVAKELEFEVDVEEAKEEIAAEEEWDIDDKKPLEVVDLLFDRVDDDIEIDENIEQKNATFIRAREFAAPVYKKNETTEIRSDFRSTIYWNPNIETDRSGKTTVEFYNSDAITSFCATVEGIGVGAVGRKEHRYFTQLPVQMSVKIPTELAFGDEFSIPLTLKNNTSRHTSGKISITPPEGLIMLNPKISDIAIAPNSAKTFYLEYKATPQAKSGAFTAVFVSEGLTDAFTKNMTFVPQGYPVEISFSGNSAEKTYKVNISDVVEGSMNVKFTAYPSVVNDLMSGIEGILREPYGCFEQTSTSSYPNLLVMRYMQETEEYDEKVMARATTLLDKGYKRLVTFETSEKGYEWFGGAPGHEALTAYGLLQFNEMQDVYGDVSKDMVKRTANWLMSRRDGKGGFMRNKRALDTYGRASEEVTNAYIVYSLTEAGYGGLDKEIEAAFENAEKTNDPYIMALVCNTLFNIKDNKRAEKMLKELLKKQEDNGSFNGLTHSITMSTGQSLTIETTALTVLAMLKSPENNHKYIDKAVQFIVGSRSSYGNFGSTQSTILALKALTEFAKYSKATDEAGTIEIYVDNKKAATFDYEAGRREPIEITDLAKYFDKGEHTIKIVYKDVKNPLPYSMGVNYYTQLPNSSEECKVKLTAKMENKSVKTGETVRLSADLQNITEDGLPMTMAVIGIPGGLSAQPWQLKEMQEKGIFDFYEIRGNKLYCYYRQMKPSETRQINLDLKAEIPGKFEAPASYSYLYYTNEHKYWIATGNIKVGK